VKCNFILVSILIVQQILFSGTLSAQNLSFFKDNGLTLEASYMGEITSNLKGGIKQKTAYLDNTNLKLSADLNEMMNIPQTTIFLNILGNSGSDPSTFIGDAQVSSNIEAYNTWKIYEAWFESFFLKTNLSLKVGLYDINSEFDVRDCAAVFLNSSHGIGVDFSQAGHNGPSIFPTTSLGIRLKYMFDDFTIQSAILDGIPGKLNDPRGTQISLSKDDGYLLINELSYMHQENADFQDARIAGGFWYFSGQFNLIKNQAVSRGTYGAYMFGEKKLSSDISGFIRVGFADTQVNRFGFFYGAGFSLCGIFSYPGQDQFGISIAYAKNGKPFKENQNRAGVNVTQAETALEFTYSLQVLDWLRIQPDFQYIINPGTSSEIPDANVLSFCFELIY